MVEPPGVMDLPGAGTFCPAGRTALRGSALAGIWLLTRGSFFRPRRVACPSPQTCALSLLHLPRPRGRR